MTTRKKLETWNDWCNDKLVLTTTDGFTALVNINTIKHVAQLDDCTALHCTEGDYFEVKESMAEILEQIGLELQESEQRKEAMIKAEEERRRAQYEAFQKAQKDA